VLTEPLVNFKENKLISKYFQKFMRCSIDSLIVTSKEEAKLLSEWVGGDKSFELLYRGTRDTFAAAVFHQLCDGKGATLTVAKSNLNKVFGGYISQPWSSNSAYSNDSTAFLFSLTEKAKCPVTSAANASYNNAGYSATFGSGHDLCIHSNANSQNTSYSNLGTGYSAAPNGKTSNTFLAGAYNFMLTEIEVYKVV